MPDVASLIGQSSRRFLPLAGADAKRAVVDVEKRTIDIAFSSEVEVDRGWYYEVLSHDAGACDLSRLQDSAPFLLDHDDMDVEAHIGVVTSAEISGDRRGRATVRLSKRQDVDPILADIADGIRPHVSVRYHINEAREVGERDGKPIVRIDKWTPLELSSVSIPADHSVGVGRSAHQEPNPKRIPMDPVPAAGAAGTPAPAAPAPAATPTPAPAPAAVKPSIDVEAERKAALDAERQRVRDILAVGERHGAVELARKFVEDGKTMDEFRQALLDKVTGDKGKAQGVRERSNKEIGLTPKEVKRFSIARALYALAHPMDAEAQRKAEFELDVCRSAADASGRTPKGLLIPVDILRAPMIQEASRAMSTDATGAAALNPSTAGVTVDTVKLFGSFIDLLRSRSIMAGLGTTLTGLEGNIEIPKQISEASAVWIGEDGDAGETEINFGQIAMAPKTVAAYTELTRRLLMQSSMDVEGLVRRELASAVAKAIDIASLYGTGTGNQPRGVANQNGIGSVTFAGVYPTYAELVSMQTTLAADDADVGALRYLINPVTRGNAMVTPKFGAGTEAVIWGPGDTLASMPATVSNRVRKTLSGGNVTTTDVFYGNWSDVLIGLWGGLDILVNPYTNALKGRIQIVVHQDCDVNIRRPESFVWGKK